MRAELGLPISVGVARTKHFAKIASQVAKPDGLVVVDPATEAAFLDHLPLDLMWGVGPVTKARLAEIDVRTIGQLALIPGLRLERLLGRALGDKLAALARIAIPAKSRRSVAHNRPERSRRSAGSLPKSGFPACAAASCGQGRDAAAGQIPTGTNCDGARALRRYAPGRSLRNADRTDFGDENARRYHRGSGAGRAG